MEKMVFLAEVACTWMHVSCKLDVDVVLLFFFNKIISAATPDPKI